MRGTRAGLVLPARDPVPIPPTRTAPQQYTTPSVLTAQVWKCPTLIEAKRNPPATATGTLLSVVVPLPSCPSSFDPQQYAAPAPLRPHA